MNVDKQVRVYGFAVFDMEAGAMRPSRYKAPRDLIETRLNGAVLEGTAELVDSEALDDEGRYRRMATAWGSLT
jgi:hypothetical protein